MTGATQCSGERRREIQSGTGDPARRRTTENSVLSDRFLNSAKRAARQDCVIIHSPNE